MRRKWRDFFTRRTLSNLLVVCVGVLLFSALANLKAVSGVLSWVVGIFSPFLVGLALAYLLNLPMRFLENYLFKKVTRRRMVRVFSILIVYILFILLIVLIALSVVPQLMGSIVSLLSNIPYYLENINDLVLWVTTTFELESDALDFFVVSYKDLVNETISMVRGALPDLLNWSIRIGSGLITGLTAFIVSIYMLFSKEKLQRQSRKVIYALIPKKRADHLLKVCSLSNRVFSGFIGGKILDSLIIGLICYAFMWICNTFFYPMPMGLLISIIIGFTNIIPFFGPFIGAIPSVLLLLLINPGSAVVFTIFVICLQQFDGNILGPKILGDSTGLPALWVLVAIIIGGGLFGFAGMVLGVPTVAVLYALSSDFISSRLRRKKLDDEGKPLEPPVCENSPEVPRPPGEKEGNEGQP
ncbi:AI-2E family transporter [Ruminococcaceae bacterium OttesenSCG-928-I18]|nr:AI-2E family transporter [Ruminococcaceae bacterium OttesenSCG-928-I18]